MPPKKSAKCRDNLFQRISKYRIISNMLSLNAFKSIYATVTLQRSIQEYIPAVQEESIVVLVHGLLHRSYIMRNFAEFLKSHNFLTIVYDYKTTRYNYFTHAEMFKAFLAELHERFPNRKIHIVTHSMGGILTRIVINDLPDDCLGNIVMLAPPHRGSPIAARVCRKIPVISKLMVKPLMDLSDEPDSKIHTIPWPKHSNIGIIAGVYDRDVMVDSTILPNQRDFLLLETGHSFMMFNRQIHENTLNFLKFGKFKD